MVSMREVETSDIHASIKHLDKHVYVPACGSQGADDFGLTLAELDLLKDVLEADAT